MGGLFNVAEESIPAPGQRFDEAWVLRGIAQRVAKFLDGGIQPGVEIDERVVGPQTLTQRVARHRFSRALEQGQQDLQRLVRKPDLPALPAKLARDGVQLEDAEANDLHRAQRSAGAAIPFVTRC
jgi:hypothetical protein